MSTKGTNKKYLLNTFYIIIFIICQSRHLLGTVQKFLREVLKMSGRCEMIPGEMCTSPQKSGLEGLVMKDEVVLACLKVELGRLVCF